MSRAQLISIAGLVLAAAFLVAGCSRPTGAMQEPLEPTVLVVRPQRGDMVRRLQLPGDLVGYYEAALHAKVTGYLQGISVDKGDWVKAGQVLATIEVPELHSNLANAIANLTIQRITYDRLRTVQKSDPRLVSPQDVDMAFAKYQEAQAAVRTLQTMVDYTRIVAPFSGIITGRFADPGALIRAGGGDFGLNETSGLISPGATEGAGGHRGGGGPILTLADINHLRVYVYVPEREVPYIQRGMPADLTFAEFTGQKFKGVVTRYASALDLSTRTMLTEIDIANPQHKLYPRMYAHVALELVRHRNVLRVPSSALSVTSHASYLYIVRHGHIVKVHVTSGLENGRYTEVVSGLPSDALVVGTFSSALRSGEKVRTQLSNTASAAPQRGGTPS